MTTILPPELTGVMFISGYRGIGKTFLASQADLPHNIAFIDFESKGRGIHSQLQFGLYRALNQESKGALEMYDLMMGLFANLEQDRYTVAVLDNVAPMELALQAESIRNAATYAKEFGLDQGKIKRNAWGHTHACVNALLGNICALIHSRGVRLIVATSHIKAAWAGGQQVPNKFRMKGHDRWQELSILTTVLIPGSSPPIPAALIQKEQLGTISLGHLSEADLDAMRRGEAGHEIQRRLPRKIDQCTFQKIRWYLFNPANLAEPAEGEVPSAAEADPFRDRLSREQLAFVTLALQKEEREEIGAAPVVVSPKSLLSQASSPLTDRILALRKENKSDAEIRSLLQEEGHRAPEIVKAMATAAPF